MQVVDLAAGDETVHRDQLVGLRHRLGHLLRLQHDVVARRHLVALHLLAALDRLAGLRVDEPARQPVAGAAVDWSSDWEESFGPKTMEQINRLLKAG